MKIAFRIWFLLITVLFQTGVHSQEKEYTLEIKKGSELYLKGHANVRDFSCAYDPVLLERSIPVTFRKEGKRTKFSHAGIRLGNRGFDCGGKGINRDFQFLLKTETYPCIQLKLKETISGAKGIKALVSITIAGKENEYTIPVDRIRGTSMRYAGELCLNINDFGLEPPKKMLGLIVVREDIEIYFNLDIGMRE